MLLLFGQLLRETAEDGCFRWLLPCAGVEGVCPHELLVPQTVPLAHCDDRRLNVEYGDARFDIGALQRGRLLLGIRLVGEDTEPFEAAPELPWLELLEEDVLTFRSHVPRNRLSSLRPRCFFQTHMPRCLLFTYKHSSNMYLWMRNGRRATDESGRDTVVEAVIVAHINALIADNVGRLNISMSGDEATLYVRGKEVRRRGNKQNGFAFIAFDGEMVNLMSLSRYWVMFVPVYT